MKLVLAIFLASFMLGSSSSSSSEELQQRSRNSVAKLDDAIQQYAFQRLAPLPKTGVVYNVTLPASLLVSGVQAVRLRSGSLRRHGLVLNEFTIPVQSLVETTSKYVVLIYRSFNAAAASGAGYGVAGYTLVTPVLGIRSYEANDLNSASSAPEFNIFSGSAPMTVRLTTSRQLEGLQCAFFDKEGSVTLSNSSSDSNSARSRCVLSQLVDSSLVIPSIAPAPAPAPAPTLPAPEVPDSSAAAPSNNGRAGVTNSRSSSRSSSSGRGWKLGIGLAVGVTGLVILLWLLTSWIARTRHQAHIANMQYYADNSETLQTALIAGSRAPAAAATRTKPVLENDYVANV